MSDALSALGNRVFLMNNVHEDQPVVFKTRWTLSYLAGPLTRGQIQRLMDPVKDKRNRDEAAAKSAAAADAMLTNAASATGRTSLDATTALANAGASAVPAGMGRPLMPPGVPEVFLPENFPPETGKTLEYRPALLASAKVHFIAAKNSVDQWTRRVLLVPLSDTTSGDIWADAQLTDEDLPESDPNASARFAPLPSELSSAKNYSRYATTLKTHLYSTDSLTIFCCKEPKQCSKPAETEADFRSRLSQQAREQRDANVEKLRATYRPKLLALHEQVRKAQLRVHNEKSQVTHEIMDAVITIGSAVVAAILSRNRGSQENIRRIGTAARASMKVTHQTGDVDGAQGSVAAKDAQIRAVEADLIEKVKAMEASVRADSFQLEVLKISPRKADISVERVALAWIPWHVDSGGRAQPAFVFDPK